MSINTPADFLSTIVRKELADEVEPYLWSDSELYLYMTEAQREFAIESKCISDSYTYEDIPYAARDPFISLEQYIIEVRRATTNSGRVLSIVTMEDFSNGFIEDDYGYMRKSKWETTTGDPTHLILNIEEGEARLYPNPTTSGSISLYVWREPFHELSADSVGFEIPNKYIYRLIYGIKNMAYRKQDFETFNLDKANENMMLWREALADGQSKVKKRVRKPRTVGYGGL